jgi:hypothetical protein
MVWNKHNNVAEFINFVIKLFFFLNKSVIYFSLP